MRYRPNLRPFGFLTVTPLRRRPRPSYYRGCPGSKAGRCQVRGHLKNSLNGLPSPIIDPIGKGFPGIVGPSPHRFERGARVMALATVG